MRKAFRHTGVLMMLGVVALGLIGAAYTLWYEDLVLETTIETGTLDADWSLHGWSDNGGEGTFSSTSASVGQVVNGKPIVDIVENATVLNGGANLGVTGTGTNIANFTNANFPDGKPQPTCTGVLGSTNQVTGDANDEAETNSLSLFAGGLYPYAGCEWQIDLANNGTVPFHIAVQSVTVVECLNPACTSTGPIAGGSPFTRAILGTDRSATSTTDDRVACWNVLGADFNLAAFGIPEIINAATPPSKLNVGPPIQIHGGEDIVCNLALVLDQRGDAEGKTYKYTITWRTFQWNEVPADSLITTP